MSGRECRIPEYPPIDYWLFGGAKLKEIGSFTGYQNRA